MAAMKLEYQRRDSDVNDYRINNLMYCDSIKQELILSWLKSRMLDVHAGANEVERIPDLDTEKRTTNSVSTGNKLGKTLCWAEVNE